MFLSCPDKSTFWMSLTGLTCIEKEGEKWSLLSGGGGTALVGRAKEGDVVTLGTPQLISGWF